MGYFSKKPSDNVFKEIQLLAISIWSLYDNKDYSGIKIERVKRIKNTDANSYMGISGAYEILQMFDPINKKKMLDNAKISKGYLEEILKEEAEIKKEKKRAFGWYFKQDANNKSKKIKK